MAEKETMTDWAFRQISIRNLAISERLCLLVISFCSDSAGVCEAFVGEIAEAAGISQRSVIRATAGLERAGFIRVARRSNDSRANIYVINRGAGE